MKPYPMVCAGLMAPAGQFELVGGEPLDDLTTRDADPTCADETRAPDGVSATTLAMMTAAHRTPGAPRPLPA